ncbi:MAG: hypothetical protein JST51_07035 [Armatimonadetes bacterium]|nr:hypothetical protein [Armatimonadota bacterium]
MLLASHQTPALPALYGPVALHFNLATTGNPFDPAVNDVRVIFHKGNLSEERLAYYSHDQWHVKGYVSEPGSYTVDIQLNGEKKATVPEINVPGQTQKGIIHAEHQWFFDGSGRPFWPVGINTAWGSQGKPVTSYFPKMKEAGMNWARVWACHWDDHNPYWTVNVPKPKDNWMSEDVLDRWDDIIKAAEKNDIHFQFVCFHHGQWSSTVNPNWQDNPWNKANGGFLASASDFFTDPEAKRRTKMLLRYLVARYGYSPSIMAWELFNEVQFTDRARDKNDWETIGKWHDEMATYIRSIDSAHHLITTSSELDKPIWREMDYMQGHGYPSSVAGMLAGTKNDGPKPIFFGEIGPSGAGSDKMANMAARREGVWAAFFAGHAGAGEYWSWDQMDDDAFKAYGFSIELLKHLPPTMTFQPQAVQCKVAMGGDLTFRPGRGWDKSDLMTFNLPGDASPAKSGQLSSFVQGTSHRDMQPQPIQFTFDSPKAGTMTMKVVEVSGSGGRVEVMLNGNKVTERDFEPGQKSGQISVGYSAGHNVLVVNNVGSDWVNVGSFTFTGIAPLATVEAVRSGLITVVHATATKPDVPIDLSDLGNERFGNAQVFDLDTLKMTPVPKTFRNGKASLVLPGKDVVIVFRP